MPLVKLFETDSVLSNILSILSDTNLNYAVVNRFIIL